jgi:trimethylamine:corrinoid methyltransferase-like protein
MEKTGGKDMSQRANVEARRILAEHQPEYVSKEQAQEIDTIAHAAQQ